MRTQMKGCKSNACTSEGLRFSNHPRTGDTVTSRKLVEKWEAATATATPGWLQVSATMCHVCVQTSEATNQPTNQPLEYSLNIASTILIELRLK